MQKGCYLYCTDEKLAEYLKQRLVKVYGERSEMKNLLVARKSRGVQIRSASREVIWKNYIFM